MTEDEIKHRMVELLEREAEQPNSGWYLSFAGEDGWRGAVMVLARGFTSAVQVANRLGINPGGEIAGEHLPMEFFTKVPDKYKDRLLNRDDLDQFDKDMGCVLSD